MTQTPTITHEVGAHPGWDNYFFRCNDREFRLLVIDREGEPRSQISMADTDRRVSDRVWPNYSVLAMQEVITPETAYRIVSLIYDRYEVGRIEGRREKRQELKECLNS